MLSIKLTVFGVELAFDVCPTRFNAVVKVSGKEVETPKKPIPVGTWKGG